MKSPVLAPLAGLLLACASPVHAAHYDAFVGDFEGLFIPVSGDDGGGRDLSVSIKAIDGGFNVSWTTTVPGQDQSTRSESIDFLATEREHVYKAAQKKNLFGGRDPLDPMKGEPYAWARVKDQTLTVHVMYIRDNGGYEINSYERTLVGDGDITTQFSRIVNGELRTSLKAKLQATSPTPREKNK